MQLQTMSAAACMSELKALAQPTAPRPGTADFERRLGKVSLHLSEVPIDGSCDQNRELAVAYQRAAFTSQRDHGNWPVLLRLRKAWWESSPAGALAN